MLYFSLHSIVPGTRPATIPVISQPLGALQMDSLYPFPDDIIIGDRSSALEYGCGIFKQGSIERCLVMWVDASVTKFPPKKGANRLAASAVGYLDVLTERWIELVTLNTLCYGTQFALEAEFIAINEAFRVASKLTENFDRLIILSDCQNILKGLRGKSRFSSLTTPGLVDALFLYANSFYDLGITVELRWVPSHSSVEGNERVDELAKQIRRSAQSILAQEAPNHIIKDLTITSSSRESLRQDLFAKSTFDFQGQDKWSHEGRVMEDGILNSQVGLSNQLPTLYDTLPANPLTAPPIQEKDLRVHRKGKKPL